MVNIIMILDLVSLGYFIEWSGYGWITLTRLLMVDCGLMVQLASRWCCGMSSSWLLTHGISMDIVGSMIYILIAVWLLLYGVLPAVLRVLGNGYCQLN